MSERKPLSQNEKTDVIAAAADLLFSARIRAAAEQAGRTLRLLRRGEDLVALTRELAPRLVILDLDARWLDVPAAVRALKADAATSGVAVVAYVSHVNESAIGAAREAGADRVLARSAFVRLLPELLR